MWNSYKYRFLPWLLQNLRTQALVVPKDAECVISEDVLLSQLYHLCTGLAGGQSLKDVCGFTLQLRNSSIPSGGLGVFVRNSVSSGKVVAIYPGTVYHAGDPVLLQSFRNAFIFRCTDGVFVDGRARGLSGSIYRSCGQRDRAPSGLTCDFVWQKEATQCETLNVGQYVNNAASPDAANVAYHECDLPLERFTPKLRRHLPIISYSPLVAARLRLVALVSTRDIQEDEELFSTYFTVIV